MRLKTYAVLFTLALLLVAAVPASGTERFETSGESAIGTVVQWVKFFLGVDGAEEDKTGGYADPVGLDQPEAEAEVEETGGFPDPNG